MKQTILFLISFLLVAVAGVQTAQAQYDQHSDRRHYGQSVRPVQKQ